MTPKVSICIPTYNREVFLNKTIESIIAQTYKDYEIVVVDDGSTDGTAEMIKKKGYPVRYFWQENSGDAAARNKLIEVARGQYISFLDSDDLLPPDAVEKMVDALPDNNENVIVYGPYIAIDQFGNETPRKEKKLYSGYITKNLFENILVHSCGSMFPTRVLRRARGFDTSLRVCSDYDLWLRLSLECRFIAVMSPLFKRRRHMGNLSKPSFANRLTEFKVLENFYYNRGGQEKVPFLRAMRRLSKEGYRAGRAAIREGLKDRARFLLKQAFFRYPSIKIFLWWMVALTVANDKPVRKRMPSDRLRIAFDLNPALVNRYSGFYAVGKGLLEGFEQLEEKPEYSLFYSRQYSDEANIIKDGLGDWAKLRPTLAKMRWLEDIWSISKFPTLEHYIKDFDIYHGLHHMMPPTKGKMRVMTVHDLRRYVLPDLYVKSKLGPFELAVNRADHFIAVSGSTKNDLCNIFGVPRERVDVVHLAASYVFDPIGEAEKKLVKKELSGKYGIRLDNYFIVFSSPDRRKNIGRIINAFMMSKEKLRENFKLVIVGSLPKDDNIFEDLIAEGISDSVLITGPMDDIKDIFSCADGLVFASLYEGFGIPILEAFGCGVPVITSNRSSMPEVAGDAALLVDPYDIDAVSQAMIELSNNDVLREELIERGYSRGREFTWAKSAEKTLGVYKKLCNNLM
ncbi:MAG: glycosyltransferase [Sedimentisphaerales bacterium]|nr:glycosyltransferase [Sedimentisphaerales bacterium]